MLALQEVLQSLSDPARSLLLTLQEVVHCLLLIRQEPFCSDAKQKCIVVPFWKDASEAGLVKKLF